MPQCALCQQDKQLVKSHIIPQFVGNWLKKGNPPGYLRSYEKPNQAVQDLYKEDLLCMECEQRFSKWERYFSESIFIPRLNKNKQDFKYNSSLIRFAISLSFRVAITNLPDIKLDPFRAEEVRLALEDWRSVLLEKKSPNKYTHYLCFLDPINKDSKVYVPPGFHTYMFGGVTNGIITGGDRVFVYTQIPGMIFISCIYPKYLDEFKGTKIHQTGRISSQKQDFVNDLMVQMMLNGVGMARKFSADLSEKQKSKILKDMAKAQLSRASELYHLEEYWLQKHKEKTERP